METQRLVTASCNSFARILLSFGVVLLTTPADRFSPAYEVMFGVADKDVWAIFYMIAGMIGFLSLYQGSWKLYRWAIVFAAFSFSILTSIFLVGAAAKVGAVLYANITLSCLFFNAGYPVFGPVPCSSPLLKSRPLNSLVNLSSNGFIRILIGYGLVLFLTPESQFTVAYELIFSVLPKAAWAALFAGLGVTGAIVLALNQIDWYRQLVLAFAVAFLIQCVLFFIAAPTWAGALLYLNLAIDCLLYHFNRPIYGFVSCDRSDQSPLTANSMGGSADAPLRFLR